MSSDVTNDELIEILADGLLCGSNRCLGYVPNACKCALAAERLKEALGKLEALASRLDSAENAMREVVSHLQHSQRGSTHWAGCSDVHPVCQAINMLVNALPSRDVEKLSPKSQSHGVNDVNLEPR